MAITGGVSEALAAGQSLAVADRVLIDPDPGSLVSRVDELIGAVTGDRNAEEVCRTLIRLGMNFAGRDAEIVGYGADEAESALDKVLAAATGTDAGTMKGIVDEFLVDMKSVNAQDSLSGLLAERIEAQLDAGDPGGSFLKALKAEMRSGVYWQMIDENYCKFGNDFARGLEYLRHYGFCQVSTNPVLAAKAFDEDPGLTETLKEEIAGHSNWKANPEAHADEIAMAATLIALWPNLSIFRPLAIHTSLKDYMVSFQLNPNIADRADESIEDARNAFQVAGDFISNYDKALGLGERSGALAPNLVFKVAASHDAARKITSVLNSDGIGSNNTVVYTVAQEVQLIIDAFEGKAEAAKAGKDVVRTYETNMGGRFASHLREVEAERIFTAAGDAKGGELLSALAADNGADDPGGSIVDRAPVICAFKLLPSLDNPHVIAAAEAAGQSAESVKVIEEDIKRSGTLVARRVYWVFFAPENRPKWVSYLQKAHGISEEQAMWIVGSMDVLPASKRIPADTLDALGEQNFTHTEFPNHQRAVQMVSEEDGFNLADYRESILDTFDPGVSQRLYELPDYQRGYDLTPELKSFLENEVGIDVGSWQTRGMQPAEWPDFGSVQKTGSEFRAAYDAFASQCVSIAKEVS
ncbi:TPA: hypothetical protein DCE37_05075 [Candidatus Latescibacteria bacterium]|nr:hypothetical protein [Candidatus Latescibacterota bacterium]